MQAPKTEAQARRRGPGAGLRKPGAPPPLPVSCRASSGRLLPPPRRQGRCLEPGAHWCLPALRAHAQGP